VKVGSTLRNKGEIKIVGTNEDKGVICLSNMKVEPTSIYKERKKICGVAPCTNERGDHSNKGY